MATLAIRYSQGTQATAYTTALWLHSSTNTYDEGWKIRYDGWVPGIAQLSGNEWSYVDEKVTLKISGSNPDNLAAKVLKLDEIINDIQFHLNANSKRVYWLFTAMSKEAYAQSGDYDESSYQALRQSPIVKVQSSYNEGLFGRIAEGATILQYTIIIKRLPSFEGNSFRPVTLSQENFNIIYNQSSIPVVGGTATMSETVFGTSPARIVEMIFRSSAGGPMTEVWAGFRSSRLGDQSLFVPVWEMEDTAAANRGDDTSVASEGSDTSPSGSTSNNKLRCTFSGTTTMASRSILTISDVTTSAQRDDQRGRHLVLLRAKVDSTRTAYIRMDSGYSGATNWRTGTRVLVDSTSWYYYSLGYVTIPAIRSMELEAIQGGAVTFTNFGIKINAQSAGGSGNLDMDCLVLIPQDDGAVYLSGADIELVESTAGAAAIYTDPFDNMQATSHPAANGGNATKMLEMQPEHFALPTGEDTVIILAAQRASSQVLSDLLRVEMSARFRWRTLRGTDGLFQI